METVTREGARKNKQKPAREGKHGLEQRTALNLEKKATQNHAEGSGQTGCNTKLQSLNRIQNIGKRTEKSKHFSPHYRFSENCLVEVYTPIP